VAQGPWQKASLAQNLEPIAHTHHTPPIVGKGDHLFHDGSESSDGTTAQVVPVAEPSGEHNRFTPLQVTVFVPELHHIKSEVLAQGVDDVHVAVGTGERDDTNFHDAKFGIVMRIGMPSTPHFPTFIHNGFRTLQGVVYFRCAISQT
jgi:hypothetical protein